ncbi:hypothetical protein K438DRAFT_1785177 [Mycena galopus ATCC 62051]|nr:hypothetical protein K438DRAFT_1785177 [Mycena galopus ATCC 62051]
MLRLEEADHARARRREEGREEVARCSLVATRKRDLTWIVILRVGTTWLKRGRMRIVGDLRRPSAEWSAPTLRTLSSSTLWESSLFDSRLELQRGGEVGSARYMMKTCRKGREGDLLELRHSLQVVTPFPPGRPLPPAPPVPPLPPALPVHTTATLEKGISHLATLPTGWGFRAMRDMQGINIATNRGSEDGAAAIVFNSQYTEGSIPVGAMQSTIEHANINLAR